MCYPVGEDSRLRSEPSDPRAAASVVAFAPARTLPSQQLSMQTMPMVASCVSPYREAYKLYVRGGTNVPVRVVSSMLLYAEFPVVL